MIQLKQVKHLQLMNGREVTHMKKMIRAVMAALAVRPGGELYWYNYKNL